MSDFVRWDGMQCRTCGKVSAVSGNAVAFYPCSGWWFVPVTVPVDLAARGVLNRQHEPYSVQSVPCCSEACAVKFGEAEARRRTEREAFVSGAMEYMERKGVHASSTMVRLYRYQGAYGEDLTPKAWTMLRAVVEVMLPRVERDGEVIVYDTKRNRPFAVARRNGLSVEPEFSYVIRCSACDKYPEECGCSRAA